MQFSQGFLNLSDQEYFQAEGVTQSLLKEYRKSPAHARFAMLTRRKATPSMEQGTAIHRALLEPFEFAAKYERGIDARRNSKEWKAFEAEHAGKHILKPDDFDIIRETINAVYSNSIAADLLTGGKNELAAFFKDEPTGLMMKGKIDCYKKGAVIDLKTTSDLERVRKRVGENGLHIQAAWYLNLCEKITGEKHDEFFVIAVTQKLPIEVKIFELAPSTIEQGRMEAARLLELHAHCLRENHWPLPPECVEQIALEPWYEVSDFLISTQNEVIQ
jgi:hypothetical protein